MIKPRMNSRAALAALAVVCVAAMGFSAWGAGPTDIAAHKAVTADSYAHGQYS